MRRVLYFAPRDCRPPNTGAKLRDYHLCRELSREAHVTYLCFEDGEPGDLALEPMASRVIAVPPQGGSSPLQLVQLARGLIGPLPLPVLKYTTTAMKSRLASLLREENFDVVMMHSLFLAAYLPILRAAKARPLLICDWHNVESEVLERYAEHSPALGHKIYARASARHMKALEKAQSPRFDAHFTVSDRDTRYLQKLSPGAAVWTLENGTDTVGFAQGEVGGAQVRRFADRRSKKDRRQAQIPLSEGEIERRQGERRQSTRRERALPHRVLFVGSMDYFPNDDAALHFAQNTWPRVHAERPEWVFTVVGRNPSPAVLELAKIPGIEITGTVPDVRPFYREALAAVVPLRVGGGSRLKILEAMAARVPVVSTTLGAEGLEVREGETILIRDEPQEMADALLEIPLQAQKHVEIVEKAHELVMARYDWSAIGTRMREICGQLLETKAALENGASVESARHMGGK